MLQTINYVLYGFRLVISCLLPPPTGANSLFIISLLIALLIHNNVEPAKLGVVGPHWRQVTSFQCHKWLIE